MAKNRKATYKSTSNGRSKRAKTSNNPGANPRLDALRPGTETLPRRSARLSTKDVTGNIEHLSELLPPGADENRLGAPRSASPRRSARLSQKFQPQPKPQVPQIIGISRGTTGFFSLALEVRNKIYHELWIQTPTLAVPCQDLELSVSYDGAFDHLTYERLPKWLLVCKSMLTEGLTQLCVNAKWSRHEFDIDLGTDIALTNKTSPIILSFARNMDFHCGKLLVATKENERVLAPGPWAAMDLAELLEKLQGGALQTLRLRFYLSSSENPGQFPWRFDLSALDNFDMGKLGRLEVDVRDIAAHPDERLVEIKAAFEEEIQRVGKEMINGGKEMNSRDDAWSLAEFWDMAVPHPKSSVKPGCYWLFEVSEPNSKTEDFLLGQTAS